MRIGGFEKQSFIDWEGKVVAVIFTKGCNYRCNYCHNPELVYPNLMQETKDIPEQDVIDYLSARRKWLDGLVITGGEPTLQNDLIDFVMKAKKMDYKIKLDTNGSSPTILERLINSNLIDYVALDIKTVLDLKEYQNICGVENPQLLINLEKSIEILKKSNIEYQLRTTVVPQFHTKEMIDRLQKEFSYCNYRLQEFREIK